MKCIEVTVGVHVRSLADARRWYERLLGKGPELEPVPGIVEFNVCGAWLQLEEGPVVPGSSALRFGVPDLGTERTRLEGLGVRLGETVTVPRVIRFFDFADPDGNSLGCYELLKSE